MTPEQFAVLVRDLDQTNRLSYATALDQIRPAVGSNQAGDLNSLMGGLYGLNETDIALALLQLSGEIHAFALADLRNSNQQAAGFVLDQAAAASRRGQHVWVDVRGHSINFDESTIASGADNTGQSVWAGIDLVSRPNMTLGFGLGVSNGTVNAGISGTADQDMTSLALYTHGNLGPFKYEGALVHGSGNTSGQRSTTLATGTVANTFSTDAKLTAIKGQLGYGIPLGREPSTRTRLR